MIVPGEGPLNAKIAFVGEAPGREEEASGRPFVGSSGRLLKEMCARMSIVPAECYFTNIMQVRPPGNDFGYFYHRNGMMKDELHMGITRLRMELSRVKPNVVVPLGNEALEALGGSKGITAWRGSILSPELIGWDCKMIPTFHPSNILRQYSNRAIAEKDLRRVREESSTPLLNLPKPVCHIKPSYDDVMYFLNHLEDGSKLSFDIETIGKRIRCLGLSDRLNYAMCIPFMCLGHYGAPDDRLTFAPPGQAPIGNYWTFEEEYEILRRLSEVFANPLVGKIAQNYPFDSTRLAVEFGFFIDGLYADTLALHHCCYSELPKSLDFLCSIYTRHPRYSDHNASSDESEWTYNCMDALVTFKVAEAVEQEARELGVWEFYKTHVEPCMVALTRAQNRFIRMDVKARQALLITETQALKESLATLGRVVGMELNPNSPKQVKTYLYDTLKLPVKRHRKTRKVTVDEKALTLLRNKHPEAREGIDLILECRGHQKLIGTFLSSKLHKGEFLKTTYNVSGTVTGRISSSQNLWKEGVNVQQTPKTSFRRVFIPREGNVFIRADLSQAEARVVAWSARIRRLIELFSNDSSFDIHSWNAAKNLFHVSLEEVTKAQREIAKAGVHGGNYGMQAKTASLTYKIPYAEAKHALDAYIAALPELPKWWRDIEDELSRSRRLKTPFGRIRIFLDRLTPMTLRSAYAFIPQSTVGDINNLAFSRLDASLPEGAFPLLQVHDEIVLEAPSALVGECVEHVKRAYDVPLLFEGVSEPLNIPVNIEIGPNWWDVEPWHESS